MGRSFALAVVSFAIAALPEAAFPKGELPPRLTIL
jgi:hypothetical protein